MHRTAARKGLLRPLPPMDLPFLVLVLTLVAFGLVMLCSASSAVALAVHMATSPMAAYSSCGRT